MATSYETIEYSVEDPVATIRLDRPERLNALSFAMLRELRSAVEAAAADPEVVGIVITGNGRAFCAGLDMEALVDVTSAGEGARGDAAAAEGRPGPDEVPGLFTYLYSVPKPVIAAVNGAAAGGGLVLATMCDLRFASPQAVFVSAFPQRGLTSEHGTTWIMPRLMGAGRALDVLWSSRRVGGEEAARIGLVEHLVTDGDLTTAAQDYIRQLAATVSPASLADTKALVYGHLGEHYATALREIDDYQWRALDRPDSKEGVASFLERRPPEFPRIGG